MEGARRSDRPPGLELLHILQDDDPGADGSGPPQHNPGKPPYVLVHGLPALGFAEVLTVRGKPGHPHRAPPADLHRVHVPNTGLVVGGVGVVGAVHQDCVRVVVDGNVNHPACRQLHACGGPTPTGEIVNDNFIE